MVKNSILKHFLVNAQMVFNGMVYHVHKFRNAQWEKYGMSIHIVVNVQIKNIGMVRIVQLFLHVLVDKFSIYNSNVFANKDFIGMDLLVTIHHVLVVNFGLDLHVLARSVKTIMGLCVLSVLTDKNGIKQKIYVSVKMDINGTAFFARKALFVLEI